MRFSNQKRAYLELAILKMSDAKLNEEANLLDRIEQLEHTIHMLTMTKPEPVKPQTIEVTIPSVEQIAQIKTEPIVEQPTPKVKVEPTLIPVQDEIQIEEIEEILNTASKSRKVRLQSIWKRIGLDYSGMFIAQILVAGEIVAVNEDKMVVVLNDLGFCNRLMRYENYQKIMEIFDTVNANITDYICIPKAIWNKILVDYKSKYSAENPIVHLEKIRVGVLRRKEPEQAEMKDEQYEKLLELVDKEKIEIVED